MADNKQSLSVSMIVKNEERHLGRLLASVVQFADEIVILDTGSSDGTRQIALDYGAQVFDFKWCDDFAKARNESLKHCTKDFVMWLDADDLIEPESVQRLQELLSSRIDWDVLYLPYYCHYSPENKSKGKRKMPPRIWRNHKKIKWSSPIHEYLVYPKGVVKKRDQEGIEILHYPLRAHSDNSDRNLRIMKKVLRDSTHHDDYLMLWHIAKEYSLLSNRRQALYFYEKAIENYKDDDGLILSRLHVGLAKQYRMLGDYRGALNCAGRAAIAYGAWREPYCEMAEDYFLLGDEEAGEACLRISRDISMHDRQVERVELYDNASFERFCLKARASKPEIGGMQSTSALPVRILAGGDVCLARQLPGLVDIKGADWSFRELGATFTQADAVLVNLETAVTTIGDFLDKREKRPYYYRCRPEMLDVLVKAGINVVNIANNHAMDFGAEAFDQELEILDACGMAHCGGGRNSQEAAEPCYVAAGGVIIAFIGVHTDMGMMAATTTRAGINHVPEENLLRYVAASVAMAKCHADLVIVTPHWGANWMERPTENRRTLARQIIDLGVDAILGHSSHILQGIEIYRGRPIVYDMGTLLFDRVNSDRMRYSALFDLEITANGARRLTIIPIHLYKGRAAKGTGADAEHVRELISSLSKELYSGAGFVREEENLTIELAPAMKPSYRWPLSSAKCYDPKGTRRISDFYKGLKSNVIYDSVPESCRWPAPVMLSNGAQVLGASVASPVQAGRGFMCEVFLRAGKPIAGRWEARLTAWKTGDEHTGGEEVFEYTHPVAEGFWPQSRWNEDEIICDRIVVRPPKEILDGCYKLGWQLVDRDNELAAIVTSGDTRVINGEAHIGEITVDSSAPTGVAGVADSWITKQ